MSQLLIPVILAWFSFPRYAVIASRNAATNDLYKKPFSFYKSKGSEMFYSVWNGKKKIGKKHKTSDHLATVRPNGAAYYSVTSEQLLSSEGTKSLWESDLIIPKKLRYKQQFG